MQPQMQPMLRMTAPVPWMTALLCARGGAVILTVVRFGAGLLDAHNMQQWFTCPDSPVRSIIAACASASEGLTNAR